jgi:integrase
VLDHSALVRRFKKALKKAGLRAIRFHDLRHTFGTRCAAKGVPMRILQEWMGHAQLSTTEIYADYAPSDHESAMIEAAFS